MHCEDMAQHFSDSLNPPDCLPFPAGALLPRQETRSLPLIPHGLKNPDRIELAYALFPKEKGTQHGLDKNYLGLTWRLHTLSCYTWGHLHGRPLIGLGPLINTEISVLATWARLLQRQPSETQEAFELRKTKPLKLVHERLESQATRESNTRESKGKGSLQTGYTVPAYTCRCYVGIASAPPVPSDADQVTTARRACDADLWAVMQRFWFKQLHSHHAQAWDLGLKCKYIVPYHSAALGVLYQLRQQTNHPLARVARELTNERLLPPSNPTHLQAWYKKLQSSVWAYDAQSEGNRLPSALCPATMGNPLHNLEWMLAMKAQLGLSEVVIRAVDTLAREVASLMTDPWVHTQLSWTKEAVQALQGRINEETKPRKQADFLKQVDDKTGFPEIFLRRRTMQKYLEWSAESWHQRSQATQKLLSRSTSP